ncbi:MAG: class I SAM-dependent methyltransferase [Firmicutes bacterium]|nr:class I SAM-dependent methyltransferase [Bacillota bacterium]
MSMTGPGGQKLTDRGIELAKLRSGARVLDIGCGRGDTVAHLGEDLGMQAEGIDINLAKISEAREAHPGADVKFGDGEFLDSYMSFTFDGILMEGSLSLINMPDEALHEAYCVLKKGGRLIISDFYEKDPEEGQMAAVRIEADRQSRIPHREGDCEDRSLKFVDFRFEGAFYQQPLIRQLEETGFQVTAFEDRSEDLSGCSPEDLMQLNKYLKTEAGGRKRSIGYFLLTAVKPVK